MMNPFLESTRRGKARSELMMVGGKRHRLELDGGLFRAWKGGAGGGDGCNVEWCYS
jgi:hypothetical protein